MVKSAPVDTDTITVLSPLDVAAAAKKQKRNHICSICSKAFKRSEHCSRHEAAHSRQRPYKCRFCDRKYARKDLVIRHGRNLHPEAFDPIPQKKSAAGRVNKNQSSQPRRPRSSTQGSSYTQELVSPLSVSSTTAGFDHTQTLTDFFHPDDSPPIYNGNGFSRPVHISPSSPTPEHISPLEDFDPDLIFGDYDSLGSLDDSLRRTRRGLDDGIPLDPAITAGEWIV
ncbi:hypothetical protein B7463_g11043, partial [Scytalidium lignicola]